MFSNVARRWRSNPFKYSSQDLDAKAYSTGHYKLYLRNDWLVDQHVSCIGGLEPGNAGLLQLYDSSWTLSRAHLPPFPLACRNCCISVSVHWYRTLLVRRHLALPEREPMLLPNLVVNERVRPVRLSTNKTTEAQTNPMLCINGCSVRQLTFADMARPCISQFPVIHKIGISTFFSSHLSRLPGRFS